MAYSRSRGKARNSRGSRVANRGGRRVAARSSRSVRGARPAARQQVVKLILGFDPSAGSAGVFKPGIPGTVGISANPAGNTKAKF